jgi:hypothetical protein
MVPVLAHVTSKGNITATFAVPGKFSIPADGATHNVTIVKLNLEAKMRWVAVPKQEAKTHLSVSPSGFCVVCSLFEYARSRVKLGMHQNSRFSVAKQASMSTGVSSPAPLYLLSILKRVLIVPWGTLSNQSVDIPNLTMAPCII